MSKPYVDVAGTSGDILHTIGFTQSDKMSLKCEVGFLKSEVSLNLLVGPL